MNRMLVAACFLASMAVWSPWNDATGRKARLGDDELAMAYGTGAGNKLVTDNCAYYTTLNPGEVVDCVGTSTDYCIRCTAGAFTSAVSGSEGDAFYVGVNNCSTLVKRKGVCNGFGSCVNSVNVGFCNGTPPVYAPQTP